MNVDHRFTQTQKRYAADDLETMSEARNYQGHVFGLVRPYVGSHVLEVGCGIGTMTAQLLDIAPRVECIEPNLNCATRAREALAGNDGVTIRVCHLEECSRAELARQMFDTVVCVNVLEHIEDDVRALALFRDVVAGTGGRVVIFVPALQGIYSQHDAALGHHRRYSKCSLRAVFAAADLDVVEVGGGKYRAEAALGIPPVVAERGVVLTVDPLKRRHEDHHAPPRAGDDVAEESERADVVFDVLEDVDADHGIEHLPGQLGATAFFEMADPNRHAVVAGERFARARGAVQVWLDALHARRNVEQLGRHRTDAAPDLQHVRADVWAHEAEDVALVIPRLAHRLEVVGGVPLLCLCE